MKPFRHGKRTHPLSMLIFFSRFLYLLLVPLARAFVALLSGGLIAWVQGAWLDLLILFLMTALSFQVWNHLRYTFDQTGLYYTNGIFIKTRTFIPIERICTLCTHTPILLRPLRMVNLRIDTLALHPKNPDLSFFVTSREANRILDLRRSLHKNPDLVTASYRPSTRDILGLCLFTSNSLLGILLISTFITQAGRLLGQDFSNLLVGFLEDIARGLIPVSQLLTLVFRLPPLASLLALFLLCGWSIAFIMNLLNIKGLQVSRTKNTLYISGGIFTRKDYCLLVKDISFIDIRQSLLTRIIGLHSVYLNAIGFGKQQSDITAIVPFSSKRKCLGHLASLLPEYKAVPRQLKPNAGAIMKFIIEPLWPCLLIPALTFIAVALWPAWDGMLYFIGFMCSVPAYWFMGVRLLDFFSSGISCENDCYTLRYSNTFYLHTVVFNYDKIVLINIRQSILQRGDKKCDLVVSTRSEGRSKHHIRNLDWDDTAALFGAVDPNPFHLKIGFWDKLMVLFQELLQIVFKLLNRNGS